MPRPLCVHLQNILADLIVLSAAKKCVQHNVLIDFSFLFYIYI